MTHILLRFTIASFLLLFFFAPLYAMDEEEEFYSKTKQQYDPDFFWERTFEVSEALAVKLTQTSIDRYDEGKYYIYNQNLETGFYPAKLLNDDSSQKTVYLTQKGLQKHQVYFCSDDKYSNILHADGSAYSSKFLLNEKNEGGDLIVMDTLGNVFIHPKAEYFQYCSFFSGHSLAFAGRCFVANGLINKFIPDTGLENWKKLIKHGHLKGSEYEGLRKSGQTFFVTQSPLCRHPVVFEELNLLYDIIFDRGTEHVLRKMELSSGTLLASYSLPTKPSGMIKTTNHVTVAGTKNGQEVGETAWIYSFHKTSDEILKSSFDHKFSVIEPLGALQDNRVAVFRDDYNNTVISVNPEEGILSTKNPCEIRSIKNYGRRTNGNK